MEGALNSFGRYLVKVTCSKFGWNQSENTQCPIHYAIFLFTSVHTSQSLSWRSRQLRKLAFRRAAAVSMAIMPSGTFLTPSDPTGTSLPLLIRLEVRSTDTAALTAIHGGGCLCAMSQSENEWVPCLAVSQGLSLLQPLHWRAYISIKYWNWQVLDNFRPGFLRFPDTSLSFGWEGSSVSFLGREQPLSFGAFYFLICRESHLVRVA